MLRVEWRSRTSRFQRRVSRRAAEEAMCSGESLSSVVMQQTGRLDCENRVRGILKSLGLDPFLYTVNGKEGGDVFFLFFFNEAVLLGPALSRPLCTAIGRNSALQISKEKCYCTSSPTLFPPRVCLNEAIRTRWSATPRSCKSQNLTITTFRVFKL